ncbi:MAG: hypothetical protein LBL90_10085 [Prevotellaceae bacterium]|nr:hypothetical protein [Prevotellaceae bacterium]
MVRKCLSGYRQRVRNLLSTFNKFLSDFGKRTDKDRSKATCLKILYRTKPVARFVEPYYKRKNISLKELSEELIRPFDIYQSTKVGVSQSIVWIYAIPK